METKRDTLYPEAIFAESTKEKNGGMTVFIPAIMITVIVAIITGGVVYSFYFVHQTSKQAIQTTALRFRDHGEDADETIEKYSDDVYKYAVHKKDRKFSVVEDFTRRLVTIRREGNGLHYCLILPLIKQRDENGLDSMTQKNDSRLSNTTEQVNFRIERNLVVNHDILGRTAREMCAGYPLHWGITGGSASDSIESRQKRGVSGVIHCTGCDCYRCGCGTITCYCDECHRHK